MPVIWNTFIKRAEALQMTASSDVANSLAFYVHLLEVQKEVYEFCRRPEWQPVGSFAQDLPAILPLFARLLQVVAANGPQPIADEALQLEKARAQDIDKLLNRYWLSPSDDQFFAKAFIQPYACWLAETGNAPVERNLSDFESHCPFCGGAPQLSLQVQEFDSQMDSRQLLCSTCFYSWSFPYFTCPNCNEERPVKLVYHKISDDDYLQVEACKTCQRYLIGIDLTELPFAVALIDEITAAPLDQWAHENGFTKIERNLLQF